MKTDAIIIGAEFDGLIAATKLREHGYSVRVFANGAGSMHYSPDGFHLLGYLPSEETEMIASPFDKFSRLDSTHPYQKVGPERVKEAISWYCDLIGLIHQPIKLNAQNQKLISTAGQFIPACGDTGNLATFENLHDKKVALVCFKGHRDFPADMICAALNKSGFQVQITEFMAPGTMFENVAIANAFDTLSEPISYFSTLKKKLPKFTQAVVFPAVLGMKKNKQLLRIAEQTLAVPCMELPTLPLSVPGMRLEQALMDNLKKLQVHIHTGATLKQHSLCSNREIVLEDGMGRLYESDLVIISNGGVLMGGVDVNSYGQIEESIFGLTTYQSHPLKMDAVMESLNALHYAGIQTDECLRPRKDDVDIIKNIFVTGRSLSHWNPSLESSNEGVCISTGWAAAENAHKYLRMICDV